MSSNLVTLAFASDSEISAEGFCDVSSAVYAFSVSAANGFTDCRFVAQGLEHCLVGIEADDYVLCVTGDVQLKAYIAKFSDRPLNLRGWIVRSNSNYFLETMDLVFGCGGGTSIPVDNYMCGANGKPVLPEDMWCFCDYFGDDGDNITVNGQAYHKAWNVTRGDVPYQFQNASTILSIEYLADEKHVLPDGAVAKSAKPPKFSKNIVLSEKYKALYDACGNPFVTNGTNVLEVVTNPIFAHGFVQCKCGSKHWTTGDWAGFKSVCCGIPGRVLCTVFGGVAPGSVLLTSTRVDASPGATRYYHGLTLKHICNVDGVACWRVTKVQGVECFVASGSIEDCVGSTFDTCTYDNYTSFAKAFKCGMLTGSFSDNVVASVINGTLDVGLAVLDVTTAVTKPWFVLKCGSLLESAWDALIMAIKQLPVMASDVLKFFNNLTQVLIVVRNGVIDIIHSVPEAFKSAFEIFKDLVTGVFDLVVDHFKIANKKFKRAGDYILFENALACLVSGKIKGVKQAGLKKLLYAKAIVGATVKVTVNRIESATVKLVECKPSNFVKKGSAVVINNIAFFHSDGVYRLMSDSDEVYEDIAFTAESVSTVKKPVFDCTKPVDFPDISSTDVEVLVREVRATLGKFSRVYDKYNCVVKDGKCVVTHRYVFNAPSFVEDKAIFVDLCKDYVADVGFEAFYANAIVANNSDEFNPVYSAFEVFKTKVECPEEFMNIDGGSIFGTFINTVNDAVNFVKSLKITVTATEVMINTVKRFKRFASALAKLYSEFMNTVKNIISIGSIKCYHYGFVKPVLVIKDIFYRIYDAAVDTFNVAVEAGLNTVKTFSGGENPITFSRVEVASVELEHAEYVKPEANGHVSVINGHTFYTCGDYYYPCDQNNCFSQCFKKVGGSAVTFSEKVAVKQIDPVYKVKLVFEFEDDTISSVCKQAIGKYISFEGNDWSSFEETIHNAMNVVGEFVDLPDYFIYDEEGGHDLTNTVMISQWPVFDPSALQLLVADLGVNCDFNGKSSIEECLTSVSDTVLCVSLEKSCDCGTFNAIMEGFALDFKPCTDSDVCDNCGGFCTTTVLSMTGTGFVRSCDEPLMPFNVTFEGYGVYKNVCFVNDTVLPPPFDEEITPIEEDLVVEDVITADEVVDVETTAQVEEVTVVSAIEEDIIKPEEVIDVSSDIEAVNHALSFMKPTETKFVDPFKFDYYDHEGIRVLRQNNNNCWVASTLVQLQLSCLLDDDDTMALFKAGSVSPLVRKCYDAVGAIVGSLGDASHCLEVLLKDLHTMFITCDATCGCGSSNYELTGSVFRFMPTRDSFSYGACGVCGKTLKLKIRTMTGTGFFCQDPKPFNTARAIVKPVCASIYQGSTTSGHYKTNVFGKRFCVDGSGVSSISNGHINTILLKDCNYGISAIAEPKQEKVEQFVTPEDVGQVVKQKPKPFTIYRNIEFYQGDVSELVGLDFDFIVNAANENLKHAGGVAAAIDKLTGNELQSLSNKYVKTNGKVKVGSSAMIRCKKYSVLNVVGPRKGKHAPDLLEKCYRTILKEQGVPLTPLISVGIFGIPLATSFNALLNTSSGRTVRCFCYTDKECNEIKTLVASLNEEQVAATVEETVVAEEKPIADLETAVERPAEEKSVEAEKIATEEVKEPLVAEKVIVEVNEPVLKVAGVSYYNIEDSFAVGADNIVILTNSKLELGKIGECIDKHSDGALKLAVSEYLSQTPNVPPGNVISMRCSGLATVVFAVVPSDGDVQYVRNVKRTISKLSKLKGSSVCSFSTLDMHKRLLNLFNKFCVDNIDDIKDIHDTKTTIKVSLDGRNVVDVDVAADQTIGEQLNACTTDNVIISDSVVTDVIDTIVNVAPEVDWDSFYGFPHAAEFHMLDHSAFAFDNDVVDGKRALVGTDNNCWINAVCLQLQFAEVDFTSEGLKDMWNEFLVGNVAKFCHWIYWLVRANKGDAGDAENALNMLNKYVKAHGTVTLTRETAEGCCVNEHRINSFVVNASVLRSGCNDGYCKHGNAYIARVSKVDGVSVIVNVDRPSVMSDNLLLSGTSYTAFSGPMDSGHYRVFNPATSKMFDGANCIGGDLCNLAVTAVVIKNKVFKIQTADNNTPVKIIKKLDDASEKFFSFGDIVSKNVCNSIIWFFTMLSIIFRAFKTRDFKVFALAPERTGVILSRSLKYNLKAAQHVLRRKQTYVERFFKFSVIAYTLYALSFMFVRFSPANDYFCKDHVEGYSNSTFVKDEYCASTMCKVCLLGFQELADLPHTKVVWKYVGFPIFVNWLPFLYLAFLFTFGGIFVKGLVCYFFAQYVNTLGVYFGMQEKFWPLQIIPFDIFGDEIVVTFIVYKALMFIKHVCFGCEKPSCVACSKSARLNRVPMQTIVNGANKLFYVVANGGSSYCHKHKFFCLNCDSYGPGNTFINETVARELSNVVKTNVQPTGESFIEVDKVSFENGSYYLYSGETFWRYNFDVTEAKYGCKEVLKNCNVLSDFIVYNNTGTNVSQIRNACVYFSQMLCKPIKLVDATLLSTLNVDFNGALHSAFVQVLNDSFSKDLSSCASMTECKQALGFDVSDEEFVDAVSNAHRFNVLLSDNSFNNLLTSYAKPEEQLSTHDVATCMRFNAKVVNHNVLIKENVPIVWLARDFQQLSEEGRKYLVKTTKAKGVTFLLTFNTNAMNVKLPAISIVNKKGAGVSSSFLWWLCAAIITFFFCVGISEGLIATSLEGFGFKYIKDGVMHDFDKPLSCVHNVFDNFNSWHEARFGSIPSNSLKCPIVVGTLDDVRNVPGVPSGILLVGKTLVFAIKAVFTDAGNCYGLNGLTNAGACLFNSACTKLEGLGGTHVYCYKDGLFEGSKRYSDLVPHSNYKMEDGNFVKLPETLVNGFGINIIRTMETTYCRVGECLKSKAGVCFGANRFFVYNDDFGSDYICGNGLFSFVKNLFNTFTMSVSVMALSGQVIFNCAVAALAIFICFLVVKFKRMFGDLSYGVCSVIAAVTINNLSYVFTQNMLFMFVYATFYFLAVRNLNYAWIWHASYVVAYFNLAPWFIIVWYVVAMLTGLLPSVLKLKISTNLFEGDKFVGTFENAAFGTFVIDMHSYEKLVNSITPDKLKQHAAMFNKYKYYSGSASEADYRCACFAHLAKAMTDYASSHQDMLYSPPSISYNSTLQAGLRKFAQPSGVIEHCIVRVSYGNMVLNGLWLGDEVICPRHVIASSINSAIDYDHEYTMMRLHNFSVSSGNLFIGVVSAKMRGASLVIKVNQNNPHTPKHVFKTLRAGDAFNILACYDGVPSGVYGTILRHNKTIRGSFINGACGSPGFNINGDTVEFVYLHQLELGSGCHVGSNMEGVMYGGFDDQPSLQIEGADCLVTVNVIAFLYGAILNGCTWFLSNERVSAEVFNGWAHDNNFTDVGSFDCFNILAAKTGVDVQRILASIQKLAKGFGGRNIIGYASLTDEFTVSEVVKQMYGVSLQSKRVPSIFNNVTLVSVFWSMFLSELLYYTSSYWIKPDLITAVFVLLFGIAVMLTLTIKHKVLFLYTFLIPSVVISACYNLAWDLYIRELLAKYFDYHMSIFSMDIQGCFNIVACILVNAIHTWRFVKTGTATRLTYVLSLVVSVYNYWCCGDFLSLSMMVLLNINNNWYIGAIAYRFSVVVVNYMDPSVIRMLGGVKVILFMYVTCGYLCCMYYGICYWFNRFFKCTMGLYEFKVSPAEFKYMVANDLRAPTGVFDSMSLSLKLMGLGGERTIKISTVQSKLTDIKCTNVVLMGCLSSMNIEANSKKWSYCVDLHNKINLCDDAEKAMEYLLALVTFFISEHADFNVSELVDSYFGDNSILQSVASTFVNMPSFIAYESARQSYEEAINNGSSPQLVKQLKRAMNIAKAELDHESSVQRKLNRMAEQAAAQMYKEARAVNKKSKVISSLHTLLFGMLRKLDMSSVDNILSLARDGVVPLSIIPAACATKLTIVVSDFESFKRIFQLGNVQYAGVVWSLTEVKDNDGKPVHIKEITANNTALTWPLILNCERIVKLQNNEVIPGKLKVRPLKGEGEGGFTADGKALFNNEGGKTFMYAFIADKPDLKVVKWEFDGGCNVIELEPPCRFAVVDAGGNNVVKYLYFVKNLNTLRRGAVLGFIGATVRLQAGKQTELVVNSSLLTLCSFAVDPAKCYLDAVKSGVKPVNNCVKMLSNGSGTGQAVTVGVEANTNQDSYGGASVCLYCRAHVDHPSIDGFCQFKGRYVQIPVGTVDPIRFCLENQVCKVCHCWLNNGCSCGRTSVIQSVDQAYLNEQGALVQLD
ncbi:ORF1a polyprotein [Bat coronavirus 1A]|uniref:ORF1a polyprotein n=1 Tax=Miniopterus bat coronavirus 1 TaxID=694000 RepID=B1PHJ4_9ALPC|nr:ORF1a polyprotein [Bat coronavirus 1A]ACA52162.1 ORF1a polyprotein [Miniopterus bat coronavirus 1]